MFWVYCGPQEQLSYTVFPYLGSLCRMVYNNIRIGWQFSLISSDSSQWIRLYFILFFCVSWTIIYAQGQTQQPSYECATSHSLSSIWLCNELESKQFSFFFIFLFFWQDIISTAPNLWGSTQVQTNWMEAIHITFKTKQSALCFWTLN